MIGTSARGASLGCTLLVLIPCSRCADGSLEALCSQHKVADLPTAPTPATAPAGVTPGPPISGPPNPGAHAAAAWSGLEGLEATLPGSSVDLHSQWFQRNCAQSSAPSKLHDMLNVPIPSMNADPVRRCQPYYLQVWPCAACMPCGAHATSWHSI